MLILCRPVWGVGVVAVERLRVNEGGWDPARGSYEEAVLTWYEQIEQSFRRRDMEPRRPESESRARQVTGSQSQDDAVE
jgi:hypothetical protein